MNEKKSLVPTDEDMKKHDEATRVAFKFQKDYKDYCVEKWSNYPADKFPADKFSVKPKKKVELHNEENSIEPEVDLHNEEGPIETDLSNATEVEVINTEESGGNALGFESILNEMCLLHLAKNTDYGNAWHEEFMEFGPICGVLRLYEKVNRLKSLYKQKMEGKVKDESFEDTLLDIANYAVMTLDEMRNLKKD